MHKFILIITVIFLASCATLPEGAAPDILSWLPAESGLIARLDTQAAPDLVSVLVRRLGLENVDVEKVRQRCSVAVLGIEADSSYHLAAYGVWPKGAMGSVLGGQWTKVKKQSARWMGPDRMELAVPARDALLISQGRMDQMLNRMGNQGAFSLAKSGEPAELTIWLTDMNIIGKGLPFFATATAAGGNIIDQIVLEIRLIGEDSYSLDLFIHPTSAELARSLSLALRLGLSARFGLSSDPVKKELLSVMGINADSGRVHLNLPQIRLPVMETLLDDLTESAGIVP